MVASVDSGERSGMVECVMDGGAYFDESLPRFVHGMLEHHMHATWWKPVNVMHYSYSCSVT